MIKSEPVVACKSAFTTLRSILANAPATDVLETTGSASTSPAQKHTGKSSNKLGKRKAAFDAWHNKKLKEICKDETTTVKKNLSASASAPEILNGKNKAATKSTISTSAARDLTAPKLSRHNDAAFYPNIQCILCHEWVCSRNRYMHIESHLQYRPYKCSVCGYDNRKQIFIELHINRVHKGAAKIVHQPDGELEKRAWLMAEKCLQHTRDVLLRQKQGEKVSPSPPPVVDKTSCERNDRKIHPSETSPASEISKYDNEISPAISPKNDPKNEDDVLLAPYTDVYRPKIYNNQRTEKSNLIEESRQLGLIPDFSDVTMREERCQQCDTHVLRTSSLMEEHARVHLPQPTYACPVDGCTVRHHSKNFVTRHMKEVHRARRTVYDFLENDFALLEDYARVCRSCFPNFFRQEAGALDRLRSKYSTIIDNKLRTTRLSTKDSQPPSDILELSEKPTCLGCEENLILFHEEDSRNLHGKKCLECCSNAQQQIDQKKEEIAFLFCQLCEDLVTVEKNAFSISAQMHALTHMDKPPFSCGQCSYSNRSTKSIRDHHFSAHSDSIFRINFDWKNDEKIAWRRRFDACFSPGAAADSKLISCHLCNTSIRDQIENRLQHIYDSHFSTKIDGHRIRCMFCNFEIVHNGTSTPQISPDAVLNSHFRKLHSGRDYPVVYSHLLNFSEKSNLDEFRRLFSICFPKNHHQTTVSDLNFLLRQHIFPIQKTLPCRLCHLEIIDEPTSHFIHLRYHLMTPVYKCRACRYADVDVDRMKAHVDAVHKGTVPYYAEPLPENADAKALRLMELCFVTNFST